MLFKVTDFFFQIYARFKSVVIQIPDPAAKPDQPGPGQLVQTHINLGGQFQPGHGFVRIILEKILDQKLFFAQLHRFSTKGIGLDPKGPGRIPGHKKPGGALDIF